MVERGEVGGRLGGKKLEAVVVLELCYFLVKQSSLCASRGLYMLQYILSYFSSCPCLILFGLITFQRTSPLCGILVCGRMVVVWPYFAAMNHVRTTVIAPNIIFNGFGKVNVVEMTEKVILCHFVCTLLAEWFANVIKKVVLIKGSFVIHCILESNFL